MKANCRTVLAVPAAAALCFGLHATAAAEGPDVATLDPSPANADVQSHRDLFGAPRGRLIGGMPLGGQEAECQFDDGTSTNALGLTDGGVIGWAQRFNFTCSDEIDGILTTYGFSGSDAGGVGDGSPVGYAIMTDTGDDGPGEVIWQGQGEVDGSAVNTDEFQLLPVSPPQPVSGNFYIVVWVEHPPASFPSPMDEDSAAGLADEVWLTYGVGQSFGDFDPENPPTLVKMADIGFPTAWMVRATGAAGEPVGACCLGQGPDDCIPNITEEECEDENGTFLGIGTLCASCPIPVECPINCPDDDLCPWDLTGSGTVGVPDLLALIGCWGTVTDPDCEQADFTNSGSVGVPDLLQMINNWGACPQGAGGGDGTAFCEPEACGENVNGGCNADPPTFPDAWTPIKAGQTVCGQAWAEGGTRDTDWYAISLDEDSTVTWSVHAEFSAAAFIINTDCANLSVLASATSPAGIPFEISADLPEGDWTLFVATSEFEGYPCGTSNNYTATVTTEPTTVTAACCFGDGTCDETTIQACAAAGGDFQFPTLTCAEAICPGQECGAAVPIEIDGPSETLDSTGNPEGTAPTCQGVSSNSPTVWFEVVGDGTTLTASTCGSVVDDVSISVFCLSCVSPVCVAGSQDEDFDCANPFQSSVSWCSEQGQTYWIAAFAADGALTPEGDITVTVTSSGSSCEPDVTCSLPPTEAQYQYDDGEVNSALTWTTRGVVAWAQRYTRVETGEVITNVATTFSRVWTGKDDTFPSPEVLSGVSPGDPVGIGILEDTGNGPGASIWWDNSFTAEEGAIATGELQIFDVPNVAVPESFYVVTWVVAHVEDPNDPFGGFPSPGDLQSILGEDAIGFFAGDVWLMGAAGNFDFFSYDPDNNASGPLPLHPNGFPWVWVLRANQPE